MNGGVSHFSGDSQGRSSRRSRCVASESSVPPPPTPQQSPASFTRLSRPWLNESRHKCSPPHRTFVFIPSRNHFLSDLSRLLYPLTGQVPDLGSQRSGVWGTCLKLIMGGLVTLLSARLVIFQRSEAGCSVALKQLILSSEDNGVRTSPGE